MARRNPIRPLPAGAFEERFNKGVLDPTRWTVSSGSGTVGTNATNTGNFSPSNIDLSSGMLRLKLTQTGTAGVAVTSTGAELQTVSSFGYGAYEWVARMSSTSTTPNGTGINKSGCISALFNYKSFSETEIDFELEGLDDRKDLLEMTSWTTDGIYYVGQATGTDTATLPTHVKNDIIIGFAYRHNSATAPTLPGGWTLIATNANGTASYTCGYRFATAPGTAADTWTNATNISFMVYRGVQRNDPIGALLHSSSTSSTASYGGITLEDAALWQAPWVCAFSASDVATSIQNAPTGMTARSNTTATGEIAGFDTDGETATWTTQTVALGSSALWQTLVFELKRQQNTGTSTTIPELYTGFNAYKFIWTAGLIEFYVNGRLVSSHTSPNPIPEASCPVFINFWGTDNINFGGVASTGSGNDRYMYVSYFRFLPE